MGLMGLAIASHGGLRVILALLSNNKSHKSNDNHVSKHMEASINRGP